MSSKTKKLTREEQLLQARTEGLANAQSIHSMKAHGKVLGLDTFSWQSPDLDTLYNAIESFPFNVIWLANSSQVDYLIKTYPKVIQKMDWFIIYDNAEMIRDNSVLRNSKCVICVNELSSGLELFKSVAKFKSIFLFTYNNEGEHGKEFESFINV